MDPNVQLTKEGELFEDSERYRRLVGKFNKCVESVYVISNNQSLGSYRTYPMFT